MATDPSDPADPAGATRPAHTPPRTSLTLLQRLVPDAARGRAIGTVETVGVTAYAAGSFLLPVAAAPLGLPVLLIGCAVACVAAVAAGIAILGPSADRASAVCLEAAAMRLRGEHVAAATVVIRQGAPADRLYFIVAGQCYVAQVPPDGGPPQHLRTMGPDEMFGEIGLLTGAPRSATVTSTTECDLLTLEGQAFLELVSGGPGLTSRLLDLHRGASASPAH